MLRHKLIVASAGMLLADAAFAQVTLDGTLGPVGWLPGPDYAITADLGRQVGGNLFHSFGQFSIHAGESATFSGPNSVNNIIGRVTGGQTSLIDGTMRSTIPGANLYLLNPAGILFGENAALDVQGSFHASTADYLRLSDGGRFDVRAPEHSLLTVAPVAAFGFLGETPGRLEINGGFLQVPAGQTLSLIGGDITLTNATIHAPGGRIDVAAVGSAGEVWPTPTDLALQGFGAMGTLTLTREPTADRVMVERGTPVGELPLADLDTSGEGGGAIFIRGGRWVSRGGWVFADTYGARAGRDIQVTITGDIRFDQGAGLTADTTSAGAGGTIDLTADTLTLSNGSEIATRTVGAGNAGAVAVTVRDSVSIAGTDLFQPPPPISSDLFPAGFSVSSVGTGNAGDLTVTTPRLTLADGGKIQATSTQTTGGNLFINVDHLKLFDGSEISSSVAGNELSDGGNVTLNSTNLVALKDSTITAQANQGRGGNIIVNAEVFLHDAADIAKILNASSQVVGNDGTVRNNAPTPDISGSLVALNTNYLDAAGQLIPRCGTGDPDERSRFTIHGRGALPVGPEDSAVAPVGRCGSESFVLVPAEAKDGPSDSRSPAPLVEPSALAKFGFNNH